MDVHSKDSATQDKKLKNGLSIALVVDSLGKSGNGTSNSARAFARELRRIGIDVRLVGIGSDHREYAAREQHIPVASWFAHQHKMDFAKPDMQLFDRAFHGVDVVHIYLPFGFGRAALKYCQRNGIATTTGFHVQPENICASAPFLNAIPHIKSLIYRWMWKGFYEHIDHIHVPTYMEKRELEQAGYNQKLHVFSNGYDDVLFPARGREKKSSKFIIVSSGRLSAEKDHETLTRAVGLSKYKNDIELRIAGAGPLADKLTKLARRTLCKNAFSIGFVEHEAMPEFLEQANLLVHSSLADIEGISVIEAMATGVVPVIADAPLSAASDFALCEHSVFEAQNPAHLAQQIDWWIEHPELREQWGMKYAREAKRKFSIAYSVQEFLRMEYEAYMQAHNF